MNINGYKIVNEMFQQCNCEPYICWCFLTFVFMQDTSMVAMLFGVKWVLMWLTFVTSSGKQPKRPSHVVIETTSVGMQSVNPSTQCSRSLLKETTHFWLLHLYLPNLTESGRINYSQQFRVYLCHALNRKS